MSGVEAVVHDARLTKNFKNIDQKKDVEIQIEVMVLLHVFNIEISPNFLSSLVVFRSDSSFGKCAVESADGRQLGQHKFVSSIHVLVRVIPLCENQIRVRVMPRSVAKFISAIRSQTLDQRVKGGGEKLQTVVEEKIADLES